MSDEQESVAFYLQERELVVVEPDEMTHPGLVREVPAALVRRLREAERSVEEAIDALILAAGWQGYAAAHDEVERLQGSWDPDE